MSMGPELGKAAAIAGMGAAIETTLLIKQTVEQIHRGEKSHNVLAVADGYQDVSNFFMTPFTDPSGWGATHVEGHHKLADANVLPFAQIAEYIAWREANAAPGHPDVPEEFDNLDYVARRIPVDRVLEIGNLALSLLADRKYQPREEYSPEEAARVLDVQTPRFTYQNMRGRAKLPTPGEWPDDKVPLIEDWWFLLMDPHSPSLHPDGPRFLSFARDMIPYMYRPTEKMFDSNDVLPDYAQRNEREQRRYENRKQMIRWFVAGHMAGGAALGAVLGERQPRQLAKNAAIGGAVIGLSGVGLIAGGTLTNYFGHLGADPWRAFRTGEITPHPDGSLATNGNVLLSLTTMDEAGWQGNHHNHPEWIDFGDGRPFQAPVGFVLKKLADKGLLGFKHGDGFVGAEHRPDELHESVVLLQQERARTLQEQA